VVVVAVLVGAKVLGFLCIVGRRTLCMYRAGEPARFLLINLLLYSSKVAIHT
jgi:hypothetical protein